MASLMGTKIVVVGGSSGIGLGVAAAALAHGAELVIVGRSQDKLLKAQHILGTDGRVKTVTADMTHEGEIATAFAGIGAFDHLVSTAGALPPGSPIGETDADETRLFIDSKFVGAVLLAKHAARRLNRGGSMTFTSGINKDKPPVPGGAVVSAVAGSFSYFARALALELAPSRVNIVSPGWVDTPMFDELVGDAKAGYFEAMAARLPIGRIASPADIASAYIHAMESDFTTGETLHIDGGQRLI
ncbi:short chain dehydrogenase [Youhaiella tibetensis]|uniref:SDR family oxidoreductase n=1 Tax=Paradevosia tibetensis TaxID=1447062 RepID=A0A5B9DKB2_9HYPH|nr:SDR family oxidoreductase [Youhaiella tibetensis]QEE19365.1 SDR family oxidoreductase [Youhaiella tibetensis]GGF33848.1 short chain dehydrogenase [Youhaiella tibetensis]